MDRFYYENLELYAKDQGTSWFLAGTNNNFLISDDSTSFIFLKCALWFMFKIICLFLVPKYQIWYHLGPTHTSNTFLCGTKFLKKVPNYRSHWYKIYNSWNKKNQGVNDYFIILLKRLVENWVFRHYHCFPTLALEKQTIMGKKGILTLKQIFVLVPNLRPILYSFGLKVCNFLFNISTLKRQHGTKYGTKFAQFWYSWLYPLM